MKCPADRIEITIPWAVFGQRRTYAMNYAGSIAPGAALPAPNRGVGVYMSDSSGAMPNWEPPGYKSTNLKDPSGTILLVELAEGGNVAGNDFPSFCIAPTGPSIPVTRVLIRSPPEEPRITERAPTASMANGSIIFSTTITWKC